MASQILNQMMTEFTDSSPTQDTTGSEKFSPSGNCFAHASSSSRCSLLSHLPVITPCWGFGFALPFNLVSAWSKRATSTQEARGKESMLQLLSGWVRSWNGLCLYFSSLPLSRLPDVLGSATEWRRKESRLLEFIHTAHRAALVSLPVCKEVLVPLTTGDIKRQTSG